jgi:hypothetical protein
MFKRLDNLFNCKEYVCSKSGDDAEREFKYIPKFVLPFIFPFFLVHAEKDSHRKTFSIRLYRHFRGTCVLINIFK